MQFCVKRAGFVFSRVLFRNRFVNFNLEGTVFFSAFLNLIFYFSTFEFFGEESEMLLLRMIGRNGVGGGTSMHFARREVEPFSCVSYFVIGLLTAIWKVMFSLHFFIYIYIYYFSKEF